MSPKTETPKPMPDAIDPLLAFKPLAPAVWMGTAWFESMAELGNEITSFVAERIKEDVQTQRALLHCKTVPEVQHLQAKFLQKAFDQYQTETGKLIEITGKMVVELQSKAKSKD